MAVGYWPGGVLAEKRKDTARPLLSVHVSGSIMSVARSIIVIIFSNFDATQATAIIIVMVPYSYPA